MQPGPDIERSAKTKLAVLAIDDDPGDAEILRRHLERLQHYELDFAHAPNLQAAQLELSRPNRELIFLDYQLGAETGHDLLQAIRSSGDMRPVIILTGQGDQTIAASLMRAGADDYVVKSELDDGRLCRAIENARSQHVRRQMESHNRVLLQDLQTAKAMLESKNRRLAELYETAHEFVDHVSHEFRTPLTVIKEFASIMRDGLAGAVSDEQREYFDIIVSRVDDLSVLIDDMLDISKLEAGMLGISRNDCTIAEIIERVRPVLERRAGVAGARLTLKCADDLPTVYCDPEKIGRVITNLVINALKFCGERGEVELRAEADAELHEVKLSVRDNGRGISPQGLQMLFQRFQQVGGQARSCLKGFGLGLSIAKELVHLNLGDITVRSKQGQGSTFAFTVPVAERSTLLERYLERMEQLRSGAAWIHLVHVTSDPRAAPELLDELRHFVQHHTRRTDLLFQVAPEHWLLVAAGEQPELAGVVKKLGEAHQQECRSRPSSPLPPLRVEYGGSWSMMGGKREFIEAFLAAEACREVAHV